MNLLIDKAEKWLTDLGIHSHRKNNLLLVRNEQLIPLGVSPEDLIKEIKEGLNTRNLFCEVQNNSVMISLL